MKKSTHDIIDNLFERYSVLKQTLIKEAVEEMITCYRNNNKLLICGNGGSASDSLHMVGELMKGFVLPRKISIRKQEEIERMIPNNADYFIDNLQSPLVAISLVNETALLTAYANDKAPDLIFAQQILGYGNRGDILIAFSTSGNSKNIIYAAQIAKVNGMKIISMTGENGGALKQYTDILINVPSEETYLIQEYHLPIYHTLCLAVENEFFGGDY